MEQAEQRGHIVEYRTLLQVWITLLFLTAALVLICRFFHEALAVWALLTITPLKAGLVFYYFMHLKYEKPFLKAMVAITLGAIIIFIGLTFFDLLYR
jgi:cytochrome c oxidase subunit IV